MAWLCLYNGHLLGGFMANQTMDNQWLTLDGSDPTLKIKLQSHHFGFARTMNAMPLAQSEYELACKYYPIVFIAADSAATRLQSVVLFGFQAEQNLFVSPEGGWEASYYIPAYAQRHPYQLQWDTATQQPVVQVDAHYPGLSHDEGMAFYEAGAPSAYLEQLGHALHILERELEQTQQWVMRLKEKGLLIEQSINLTLDDQTQSVAGVWVVDFAQLDQLDDTELAQMYHNGTLSLIEQHRISLSNLDVLAQRVGG